MSKFEKLARESDTAQAALAALHEAGATFVEALAALRTGRRLSLTEAKQEAAKSIVWAQSVEQSVALGDLMERSFRAEGEPNS